MVLPLSFASYAVVWKNYFDKEINSIIEAYLRTKYEAWFRLGNIAHFRNLSMSFRYFLLQKLILPRGRALPESLKKNDDRTKLRAAEVDILLIKIPNVHALGSLLINPRG